MIIIPARLKSTRFPNKVLAQIHGIPMIVRTAELAKEIDDVVVACDEPIIAEVCMRYKKLLIILMKFWNIIILQKKELDLKGY